MNFEYKTSRVDSAMSDPALQKELDKQAAQGFRLHTAYLSGPFHRLYFERMILPPVPQPQTQLRTNA